MPVKARIPKRRVDASAELAAWSMLFETGHDYFHDLADHGFANESGRTQGRSGGMGSVGSSLSCCLAAYSRQGVAMGTGAIRKAFMPVKRRRPKDRQFVVTAEAIELLREASNCSRSTISTSIGTNRTARPVTNIGRIGCQLGLRPLGGGSAQRRRIGAMPLARKFILADTSVE